MKNHSIIIPQHCEFKKLDGNIGYFKVEQLLQVTNSQLISILSKRIMKTDNMSDRMVGFRLGDNSIIKINVNNIILSKDIINLAKRSARINDFIIDEGTRITVYKTEIDTKSGTVKKTGGVGPSNFIMCPELNISSKAVYEIKHGAYPPEMRQGILKSEGGGTTIEFDIRDLHSVN